VSSRRRTRQLLERAFDGTLDAEGYLELERLAAADAALAEEAAAQRRLVAALEGLEEPEAEPFDVEALVARVERAIDTDEHEVAQRPRAWRGPLVLVAVAAAAALALWAPWQSEVRDSGGPAHPNGATDDIAERGVAGPGAAGSGITGDGTARGEVDGNQVTKGEVANGESEPVAPYDTDRRSATDLIGTGSGTGTDGDAPKDSGWRTPRGLELSRELAEVDTERFGLEVVRAASRLAALEAPANDSDWRRSVRTALRENPSLAIDPAAFEGNGPTPSRGARTGAEPVDLARALVAGNLDPSFDGAVERIALTWLLLEDDPIGRRLVSERLGIAAQVPDETAAGPDADSQMRRRELARDAFLVAADPDRLVRAIVAGELDGRDGQALVEALERRGSHAVARFRDALGRGAWHEADGALLATVSANVDGLARALVDGVVDGSRPVSALGALRENTSARQHVADLLSAARSVRERERLFDAVGVLGATEALDVLRERCLAGDRGAVGALLELSGRDAVAVWLEVAPFEVPIARMRGWERVATERATDLVDLARDLPLDDPRVDELVEGMLIGDAFGSEGVLLVLAARADVDPALRTVLVDAAIDQRIAAGDADPPACSDLVAALGQVASSAPDDMDVQAACFTAIYRLLGRDAAEVWCRERFDDDVRPLDAFERGRPESAGTRARVRLLLERTSKARARA
jgi:hypothetical protein